jgi:hypothetical protein
VSSIIWGRWTAVLGKEQSIDLTKQLEKAKAISINDYFALLQTKNTEWQIPSAGTLGFTLKDSEAFVNNQTTGVVSTARIQNGNLNVDFANTSFTTSFDLLTKNETFKLQAQGTVYSDGQFTGRNIYPTNMIVNGVLADKGSTAAYLFQSRLDDSRLASGITTWGK